MLPNWLNGTFILTMTGIVGGGCFYLLLFCLKSRCRHIECCCIKCERDVIPVAQLNQVELSTS